MRVAVVGGGLFGTTAAIHLARAGHHVELFEKSPQILTAASAVNQLRLHEGYHYPRSDETAAECRASMDSFIAEYGGAVIDKSPCYYAIAKENSHISAQDYLAFCDRHGLVYERISPLSRQLELTIRVSEKKIDLLTLQSDIMNKLSASGICVHYNSAATKILRDKFDRIIIAGYAGTNAIAACLDLPEENFQFEVVEKPVIQLPRFDKDVSIVVMDGPFCCIDPFGRSGCHLMGHVSHALHAVNIGTAPEIPAHLNGVLNRGIGCVPEISNFERMREAGAAYIPQLRQARYVGSMFTIRTVLPYREHDDARPTVVTELDDQCIRIFSGKMGTAVTAARTVVEMLRSVSKRENSQAFPLPARGNFENVSDQPL